MNVLLAFLVIFAIVITFSKYDVRLNIVFGTAIAIGVVYYLYNNDITSQQISNTIVYEKLENLLANENLPPPNFFFMDCEIILLFDSVKENLQEYNRQAFVRSINSANNVLEMVYQSTLNDFIDDKRIDNVNDLQNYSLFPEKKKYAKVNLNNLYEMLRVADDNYRLCLNYLHSFCITAPNDYTEYLKLITDKIQIRLKRNIDIIKSKIDSDKSETNVNKKFIQDYDDFKSFSQLKNDNATNFEVY